MKLGLGTAQFGMDYGISNVTGKTPVSEVRNILILAADEGIRFIDTACLYGESEQVLGMSLSENSHFSITTKTPRYDKDTITDADAELLETTFLESLRKLDQRSVYGLLIHNSKDLLAVNGYKLWGVMEDLRRSGLVSKIGISAYSRVEIDAVLEDFDIDIIQIPVNIFDQRLIKNGCLKMLKERGIEIHARSALLQGLLLMRSSEIPAHLLSIKDHFEEYLSILESYKLSQLKAALGFVLRLDEVDAVIVGVNHSGHLMELLKESIDICNEAGIDFSRFAIDEESIVNPSLWKIPS